MTMIHASPEKPVLLCMTCQKATAKVMRRMSPTLRQEKRKTWKRVIRPNNKNVMTVTRGKEAKIKDILYSVLMQECFEKKHKMSIRNKPFPRALMMCLI